MTSFEWDESKERRNRNRHGVSFRQARGVFQDPFALMLQDRIVDGEERWQAIGRYGLNTVIVVAHVVRTHEGEEVIRIISARHALRHERESYETQAY
jgi:uncharacterized DUF497 family protein